jgi:hypothetical protein
MLSYLGRRIEDVLGLAGISIHGRLITVVGRLAGSAMRVDGGKYQVIRYRRFAESLSVE